MRVSPDAEDNVGDSAAASAANTAEAGNPAPSVSLTISIVLHDSALTHLSDTLRSLEVCVSNARRAGVLDAASLVILDNNSSPQYREALPDFLHAELSASQDYLPFTLLMPAENPGFGEGHNKALAGVDSSLLLVLNPDVELAPDALLLGLAAFAAWPTAVAANPRCARIDGRREYLCKRYPTLFDLLLRGAGGESLQRRFDSRLGRYEYRDLEDTNEPREVTLLSGACLLIRRTAFVEAGAFNPRYFMYFEDFDLSLRLAQQGQLLYLPAMRVIHRGGDAARKGGLHIRWFMRSALRFFSSHGWQLF